MTTLRQSVEGELGGLSEAEWEYAWRYADHLSVGEPEPDAAGFDPERAAVIRRALHATWHVNKRKLNRRAR